MLLEKCSSSLLFRGVFSWLSFFLYLGWGGHSSWHSCWHSSRHSCWHSSRHSRLGWGWLLICHLHIFLLVLRLTSIIGILHHFHCLLSLHISNHLHIWRDIGQIVITKTSSKKFPHSWLSRFEAIWQFANEFSNKLLEYSFSKSQHRFEALVSLRRKHLINGLGCILLEATRSHMSSIEVIFHILLKLVNLENWTKFHGKGGWGSLRRSKGVFQFLAGVVE